MILVDTYIWVDFFRGSEELLSGFLERQTVLCHPMTIGELACGNLPDRQFTLSRLSNLQRAEVIDDIRLLTFIETHKFFGKGIGYVDCHLLASTMLGQARYLWTRDRRLHAAAVGLGVAFSEDH